MESTKRFGVESRFNLDEIRPDTEYEYKPRSETNIPAELKDKFEQEGYRLRWVRYLSDGRTDTKNLRQKQTDEGFTFVRPDELGDEASALGDAGQIQGFGDCVLLGDLVLMKTPTYKAEARKRYYENETRKGMQATEELLRQNAIENGSRSTTKTGKGAARYSND